MYLSKVQIKKAYILSVDIHKALEEVKRSPFCTLLQAEIDAVTHAFLNSFQKAARVLENELVITPNSDELISSIDNYTQRINQLRESGQLVTFEYDEVMKVTSLVLSFGELADLITGIHTQVTDFNHPDIMAKKTPLGCCAHKRKIYFNKLALKQRVKMTLGVFAVFMVSFLAHLPGLIQSLISIIIFTAQANIGQATLKAKLRTLGILSGGLCAIFIIYVLSYITHFTLLLALLAVFILIFSYIAVGSNKYSYLGLQAAIIIAIVLLGESSINDSSFDVGILRFIGVVEAIIVGGFFTYFVWPTYPLKLLKKQLYKTIESLSSYYKLIIFPGASCSGDVKINLIRDIEEQFQQHTALINDFEKMIFEDATEVGQMIHFSRLSEKMYLQLYLLDQVIMQEQSGLIQGFIKSSQESFHLIHSCFEKIAQSLKSERSISHIIEKLDQAETTLKELAASYRKKQTTQAYSLLAFSQFANAQLQLHNVIATAKKLNDCACQLCAADQKALSQKPAIT